MINTIIFDIDGTLLNGEIAVYKSMFQTIKEFDGKEYAPENSHFVIGQSYEESLAYFGVKDIEGAMKRWLELYMSSVNEIVLFDGIEELLKTLKKEGYTLGVVTSRYKYGYDEAIEGHNLIGYFDFYVCADDTLQLKPSSDPMHHFLTISGKRASECIYIGDTLYDEMCAHGANVTFAVAKWGAMSVAEFRTKIFLKEPKDLLLWLKINITQNKSRRRGVK
ncbi:MAG: HAD family hydrolase [Fusobacteria bacterium]|nr:HAD family hydrolase [Fusobacteriota bacterium]